jgi:hypothetical protein
MVLFPDLVPSPLIEGRTPRAYKYPLARWDSADLADPSRRPQGMSLPIKCVRGYDFPNDFRMKPLKPLGRIWY